ncbi:hypothetical protein VNO80_10578 [Phaseolus coccineus]|uniref:Uncharacterized protein n=1 Tax=Phaseolus coccineus TaxID=3886 RepID=A0AAN9N8X9_PHACN
MYIVGALNEDPEICSPWQKEVQGIQNLLHIFELACCPDTISCGPGRLIRVWERDGEAGGQVFFMQNVESGIGKLHSYAAYVIRMCVCLLYAVAANSDAA